MPAPAAGIPSQATLLRPDIASYSPPRRRTGSADWPGNGSKPARPGCWRSLARSIFVNALKTGTSGRSEALHCRSATTWATAFPARGGIPLQPIRDWMGPPAANEVVRPTGAGTEVQWHEPTAETGWHGWVSYLIGGMGRLASPGCMTKVWSSVYQGACTSGTGGVSFAP